MGGPSSLLTSEVAAVEHWLHDVLDGENELGAAMLETLDRLEDTFERWLHAEATERTRLREQTAQQQALLESLQRERRWIEERQEDVRRREEAISRQLAELDQARKEWQEQTLAAHELRNSSPPLEPEAALRLQEQLAAVLEKLGSVSDDFKESLGTELVRRLEDIRSEWLGSSAASPAPPLPPELMETLTAIRERLSSPRDEAESSAELRGLLQDAVVRLESGIRSLGESASASEQQRIALLEERLHNLQTELHNTEQERANLETELEFVRHRAAELLEMLGEQRRQMAEERATWWAELKRLRRLMEVLLDHQLETPPGPQEEVRGSGNPPRVVGYDDGEILTKTGTEDTALDSASQQFELLQRDFSRRRRATRE